MPEDLIGIPRLLAALSDSMQQSEENAVKYGTNYVENETGIVENLKEMSRAFGADFTDPQWYAGAVGVLSYIVTYSSQSLLGALFDHLTGPLTMAIARVHNEIEQAGVEVFGDAQ